MSARRGVVVAFDVRRGLGEIEDVESGERLAFHCTAIADGSRNIDVGREVTFEVAAGHLGRWEAREITPADTGGTSDRGGSGDG